MQKFAAKKHAFAKSSRPMRFLRCKVARRDLSKARLLLFQKRVRFDACVFRMRIRKLGDDTFTSVHI